MRTLCDPVGQLADYDEDIMETFPSRIGSLGSLKNDRF